MEKEDLKKLELGETDLPGVPCKECLSNPERFRSTDHIAVVYCEHSRAGAMVGIKDGRPVGAWQIYSPISMEEWNKFLADFNRGVEKALHAAQADRELEDMPEDRFIKA